MLYKMNANAAGYQMGKSRCFNLATIRSAGTIRHQVNAKLSL